MNKRGSAIVEAVMIFPLAVMSAVILIFIMIYFYTQLCDRVDMHIMLRAESGQLCENVFYENEVSDAFTLYRETQQIYSIGTAELDRKMLLEGKNKEFSARKYLVDEGRVVRMAGITGEVLSKDEKQ